MRTIKATLLLLGMACSKTTPEVKITPTKTMAEHQAYWGSQRHPRQNLR
jgi:hypothetical protein